MKLTRLQNHLNSWLAGDLRLTLKVAMEAGAERIEQSTDGSQLTTSNKTTKTSPSKHARRPYFHILLPEITAISLSETSVSTFFFRLAELLPLSGDFKSGEEEEVV